MKRSSTLARAWTLYRAARYELARDAALEAIQEDPALSEAYCLLAFSLSDLDEGAEAIKAARQGIALAPQWAYPYYVLGYVALQARLVFDALAAAESAVKLESDNANYYSFLARVWYSFKDWSQCLELCDRGLSVDPTHAESLMYRGLALMRLGRNEEAEATLKANLAQRPEHFQSHAGQGWVNLHAHEYDQALEYFKEALRLSPNYVWAREGLRSALKARHRGYRIILAGELWLSRLPMLWRPALTLFVFLLLGALVICSVRFPLVKPYAVWTALIVLTILATNWVAGAIFNFALWLHPLGKLALTKSDLLESQAFLVGMLISIGDTLLGLLTRKGGCFFAAIATFYVVICYLGVSKQILEPKRRQIGALICLGVLILLQVLFLPDALSGKH